MSEQFDTGRTPADWLDRALSDAGREARGEHVADAGFTARVAAALPAPATVPAWRRPVVVALWSIAAAGVVVAIPGVLADVAHGLVRVLGSRPFSLADVATVVAALGTASWAATCSTSTGQCTSRR